MNKIIDRNTVERVLKAFFASTGSTTPEIGQFEGYSFSRGPKIVVVTQGGTEHKVDLDTAVASTVQILDLIDDEVADVELDKLQVSSGLDRVKTYLLESKRSSNVSFENVKKVFDTVSSLDTIDNNDPVTRSTIVKKTKLSMGTVVSALDTLIDAKVVSSHEMSSGKRGRPVTTYMVS
jgi:hypothetical protein